jgi:hypothetical protein
VSWKLSDTFTTGFEKSEPVVFTAHRHSMPHLFTIFLFWLTSSVVLAQSAGSPDLQRLAVAGGKTPSEIVTQLGQKFLGFPYVAHTLDVNQTEQLVVNLKEFDCTTYVENVLALTLAWHALRDKPVQQSFEQLYRSYLTQLRYRDGRIKGYGSRLHYFSDWLRDNERKGLVIDVTGSLPGSISVAKAVSYMSSATYKYPQLTDPTVLQQVTQTEALISQQPFSFVPKSHLRQAEAQLQEGDIVMLTAARPGLDMKHVGIAIRQPDGRMHLLHASSEQGAVVITTYPLTDYVLYHRALSGIRVARLRPLGILTADVRQE